MNVFGSFEANYRRPALVSFLRERLISLFDANKGQEVFCMEVCGTHTVSIFRHGIRSLLPPGLHLISGPGCPVCVTSQRDIDAFIWLSRQDCILTTFGDLMRVPGTQGSLQEARATGARVLTVYSPMDVISVAKEHLNTLVVFLGVGFETTIPGIASMLFEAKRQNLSNLTLYPAMKLMPPALHAIFSDTDCRVQGLLCPGHVSAIIGARAYEPIANQYKVPCVITGFEPVDIMQGLCVLAERILNNRPGIHNAYERVVSWDGNQRAMDMMQRVFLPADAEWRGLGILPQSGLALRPEYADFDVRSRISFPETFAQDSSDLKNKCRCGEILKGKASPSACPLFGRACTPSRPFGPCMVSTEGTCAAFFKYGGQETCNNT
jgi:hydrogenase expression/formation protein HypD